MGHRAPRTRRRARSILTIATIGVAIAGIWLFAIPGNVDRSLNARAATDAMHTARLAPTAADLSDGQLAALREVANVEALDTRTLAITGIRAGDRSQGVILVGVEDFDRQPVNIVSLDDGAYPATSGQLVTDIENGRTGRYRGNVGDTVEVRTHTGAWESFEVAGRGGTLRYSNEVSHDAPVFYMSNADVQRVMDYPAPNSIDVIAIDPAPEAVAAMVTTLRADLAVELPDLAYWDVLEVWREGTWPGSEDFVGEVVTVETRRGPADLEVIGIDGHLVNDGQGLFMPFRTVLDYEGWTAGNYWVRTTDPGPDTVDAAASAIHRTLQQNGYEIGSNIRYIDRGENMAENRLIVTVVMALGLPVVAIGMIGLVSAMTSNILDRTREIGILRSIGARRRDLRAMFRAEGLAIALIGWLLGIPIGYGLGRFIIWVLENEFQVPFEYRFPLWPIAVSLLVTLAATLLVLWLPLRKVLQMQPGALRYE